MKQNKKYLQRLLIGFVSFLILKSFLQYLTTTEDVELLPDPLLLNPIAPYTDVGLQVLSAARRWNACFSYKKFNFEKKYREFFMALPDLLQECREKSEFRRVQMVSVDTTLGNRRWHIMNETAPATVVSLGIRKDVSFESKLRVTMDTNVEFFGSDGLFQQENSAIYSKVGGEFLPIEIQTKNGKITRQLKTGGNSSSVAVAQMDLVTYLTTMIDRKLIDNLLINSENELQILTELLRGKSFDIAEVIVCQVNVKIEFSPKNSEMFLSLWNDLTLDDRYLALNAKKNENELNAYLVNVQSSKCLPKYIEQFFI